jgi:hypothetical protein
MTPLQRDNARRVKKVRARVRRECNAPDPTWPSRFRKLEAELLKARPHLADQQFCGLAEGSDAPRRRVLCPNGVVLFTTWYKVPTTEADARRAWREAQWLNEQGRRAA